MLIGSQNIDKTGEPQFLGSVVATQETHQGNVRRALPTEYRHRFVGGLGLSWDPARLQLLAYRTRRLHPAGAAFGLRGFSPTRWVQVAVFADLEAAPGARPIALLNTHLVDSAWEANPSHPRLRRRLWRHSMRVLRRRVRAQRAAGRSVILCADLNITRRPVFDVAGYLGLVDVAGVGLDWILATPDLDVAHAYVGDHTGHGRHTHPAIGVEIR